MAVAHTHLSLRASSAICLSPKEKGRYRRDLASFLVSAQFSFAYQTALMQASLLATKTICVAVSG